MSEGIRKINPIVNFSVTKRVSITMLALIMVVFGLMSLTRMPLEMMPDISFPTITVVTSYQGVAPQEIEQLVTEPIERAISSVNNVKKVSSSSAEGYSSISVEFEWGTNLDVASMDIRDYIAQIRGMLPTGINDPLVYKFDMSQMPVLLSGVSGNPDSYKLRVFLEDNVQQRLQRLDGVAQVQIMGGDEREIQISVDPIKLKGKSLAMDNIIGSLRSQNSNTPAGYFNVANTDILLRAMGEYKDLDDIRNTVVGASPNGIPVKLYEVANVIDTYKEKRSLSKINGESSVFLIVSKQSGSNTLKVSQKVSKEIEAITTQFPEIKFSTIFDQGDPVKRTTKTTVKELLIGGMLAILLLFIFLGNIRPTLIISVAIPLSIITTFIILYSTGFTLNIMTLGGLALGIGRLVDDAVVVIENIFRHLENGESPQVAAKKGASEVSMAIVASTFTTIIVFLPMLFSKGIAGELMRGLSLTIAFALLASLFVAFTIVPMLSSIFFRKPKKEGAAWFNVIKNFYSKTLKSVLKRPGLTIGSVFLIVIVSVVVGLLFVGKEFMPASDNGMMAMNVELPQGTTLDETTALCGQIREMLLTVPEVKYVGEMIGRDDNSRSQSSVTGTNGAVIYVRLTETKDRDRTQQEIQNSLRDKFPVLNNGKITFSNQSSMGGGKPVSIYVYGTDLNTLKDISQNILDAIKSVPGLKDLESSFSKARPEYHFKVDRQKALLYGLSPSQVQSALQAANLGTVATQLRTGDDEIDMRVILDKKYRSDLDYIRQFPLKTPTGAIIPLSQVTTMSEGLGPVTIKRDNKYRIGIVDANLENRPLGDVVKDVEARLDQIKNALPEGYALEFKGEFQDMQEAFLQLLIALIIAILLIYMIMASQFESLVHPFVIMFTIPLAAIGVVWILLILGKTLSIVTFMGIIILVGIVISNGIVMVDYINQLREAGKNMHDSLVEGCQTRLRPVIITALATIVGMIPMAFFGGKDGSQMAPMATAVIGGLISSTFLTLYVIPIVYQYVDQIAGWIKHHAKKAID
ncbi:MAG: efflux RND transporter permease subunit [Fibrobacter sp.]|nr:efflux RND transporter permease subunit [Fibrobacter sp.]